MIVFVITLGNFCSRRERNSAQHFSETGPANGIELLLRRFRSAGVLQHVRNGNQLIRIRSAFRIATTVEVMAHRVTRPSRSTCPTRLRRPSVAGDQGRLVAALVPVGYLNVRWSADQSRLQRVCKAPGIHGGIKNPFLETGGGLCGGVRIKIGSTRIAVALIRNVDRVRIGKPDAKGVTDRRSGFSRYGREAGEDAHVVR